MLNSLSSRRRAVTFAALLGVCSSPSLWAQENTNAPTTSPSPLNLSRTMARQRFEELPPGAATQISIPIRNIKASLMAYWLDPAHHQAPIDVQIAAALAGGNPYLPGNQEEPRLPGNGKGPVGLKLPAGVTNIVVIEPQNSLLVTGTKEGLQTLSTLIPTIDVPLIQYEIEAQFIQLPLTDLPQLGLKFGKSTGQSPYQFGSVTKVNDIQLPMMRLLDKGRTKVLTAPRVTVIDGLTGQLQQITSTPFLLDATEKNQVKTPANPPVEPLNLNSPVTLPQNVGLITTSIGIRVTTVRAKDNLISLSITPTLGTRTISVAAKVRDGESFAIQLSPATDKQQIVVIVTTRQIRRIGDDDAQSN